MIYFFNRGLILEQEVVKALKKYLKLIRVSEYYQNYTVTVTNEHPFARLYISDTPDKEATSLFPVIVVATETDVIPAELSTMSIGNTDLVSFEPEDFAATGQDGKSYIERRYEMITPTIMSELRKAMDEREDKRIFGTTMFMHRRDNISIEIWAENLQLKNELYETIRLFVCGFLREYLSDLYKGYFTEIGNGQSPLVIFDSSVRGQRSNNFNVEFGIELSGAQITFEADYVIEQTMIDTEAVDTDNILLEVINHVRQYEETTREWVIGPDNSGDGGTGGTQGNAEPGGSEPTGNGSG